MIFLSFLWAHCKLNDVIWCGLWTAETASFLFVLQKAGDCYSGRGFSAFAHLLYLFSRSSYKTCFIFCLLVCLIVYVWIASMQVGLRPRQIISFSRLVVFFRLNCTCIVTSCKGLRIANVNIWYCFYFAKIFNFVQNRNVSNGKRRRRCQALSGSCILIFLYQTVLMWSTENNQAACKDQQFINEVSTAVYPGRESYNHRPAFCHIVK